MRAPVVCWMQEARSPVLIADEVDFRFGAPDLLAAHVRDLRQRIDDDIKPVQQLDQLALLEQIRHGSMTRLQIEGLTSMRWQDYERRVLDQLLEDGLIIFDEVEERWSVGRSLSVPYTELVAVEMKLRDGRRALAQAMRYRAFANESLVALPQNRIDSLLVDACASRGVGLLAVGAARAEVVVNAVASAPLDPLVHRLAQEMLLARHCGHTTSLPAGSPRGHSHPDVVLA
jgi:uncharacterized protein YeeX (DUF496 family)